MAAGERGARNRFERNVGGGIGPLISSVFVTEARLPLLPYPYICGRCLGEDSKVWEWEAPCVLLYPSRCILSLAAGLMAGIRLEYISME